MLNDVARVDCARIRILAVHRRRAASWDLGDDTLLTDAIGNITGPHIHTIVCDLTTARHIHRHAMTRLTGADLARLSRGAVDIRYATVGSRLIDTEPTATRIRCAIHAIVTIQGGLATFEDVGMVTNHPLAIVFCAQVIVIAVTVELTATVDANRYTSAVHAPFVGARVAIIASATRFTASVRTAVHCFTSRHTIDRTGRGDLERRRTTEEEFFHNHVVNHCGRSGEHDVLAAAFARRKLAAAVGSRGQHPQRKRTAGG